MFERSVLVEAVGHRERLTVIGDGQVFQAGLSRRKRHRLNIISTIRRCRMRMKVSAEILKLRRVGRASAAAASISPRPSRSSGGMDASPSAP